MINSPNNQLDEFVKETLKNHEVPFNEAHWNEFESKLTTKPRINMANNWRFSLNVFIGLIVAGTASAFIYYTVTSPSNNNNTPTVSKEEIKNSVDNRSITKKSTSVIDEYNSTNHPIVINQISDNNTYSIFTSADISNIHSSEENQVTPNGYFVTPNNNKIVNVKPVDNEKIDPNELQKQLDLAKLQDKSRAVFPDMLDKHDGAIYNTKESDTIKEKAEKDFNDFFLTNPNGKADGNAVKSFMDKTEKKGDSGIKITNDRNYITPLPVDSTSTNNNQ